MSVDDDRLHLTLAGPRGVIVETLDQSMDEYIVESIQRQREAQRRTEEVILERARAQMKIFIEEIGG